MAVFPEEGKNKVKILNFDQSTSFNFDNFEKGLTWFFLKQPEIIAFIFTIEMNYNLSTTFISELTTSAEWDVECGYLLRVYSKSKLLVLYWICFFVNKKYETLTMERFLCSIWNV